MPSLFDPLDLGDWKLPNRVIMAPLTRCRAGAGRVPVPLNAEYYAQRASAGLIISEATSVSPMGVGYPSTPGIWSSEQVEGWKLVTRAVHNADRFAINAPLNEPNPATFYASGPEGYTDYPFLDRAVRSA